MWLFWEISTYKKCFFCWIDIVEQRKTSFKTSHLLVLARKSNLFSLLLLSKTSLKNVVTYSQYCLILSTSNMLFNFVSLIYSKQPICLMKLIKTTLMIKLGNVVYVLFHLYYYYKFPAGAKSNPKKQSNSILCQWTIDKQGNAFNAYINKMCLLGLF